MAAVDAVEVSSVLGVAGTSLGCVLLVGPAAAVV